MIIGLAILFLVILFILSEVWKRDEEEDEKKRKKTKTRTMRKRPKSFAAERKLLWKKKRNGKNRK